MHILEIWLLEKPFKSCTSKYLEASPGGQSKKFSNGLQSLQESLSVPTGALVNPETIRENRTVVGWGELQGCIMMWHFSIKAITLAGDLTVAGSRRHRDVAQRPLAGPQRPGLVESHLTTTHTWLWGRYCEFLNESRRPWFPHLWTERLGSDGPRPP